MKAAGAKCGVLIEFRLISDSDNKAPSVNEQNEYLQKELNRLRVENERVSRRKNELELLIEHNNMKQAFSIGNEARELKVVHLEMNPADEAYENYKNEADKLRAEVERLKRKMRKMEEEHEDLTTRLNETTAIANTTVNIQEVGSVKLRLRSRNNGEFDYRLEHLGAKFSLWKANSSTTRRSIGPLRWSSAK